MSDATVPASPSDLRSLPDMRDLPDADLKLIFSAITARRFDPGDTWTPGTPRISIVWSGLLRMGILAPTGKFISLRMLEPGDVTGAAATFSGAQQESYHIVSDTGGVLLAVHPTAAWGLFESCTGFRKLVVIALSRAVVSLGDRLFEFGTMSARSRLQAELLRLCVRGQRMGAGVVINPAPTHETLADQIGVSREVITRLLGDMNLEGMIQSGRGKISVPDLAKLREAVDRDGGNINPSL
ncbi:MAG: Crp/Fnr family transcriptional regulator [Alphaproteobacteria bacterium]